MDEPSQIGEWNRISVLGSGAFGVVTLWKHKISQQFIAIKKCKFHLNSNISSKQRSRWENEVEHMKSIKHSNIIAYKPLPQALDDGLSRYNPTKLPLLSMEYCTKGNLRRVLTQVENSCGLSELEVRNALEDISRAVMHLHSIKITHRDIKPDNIVLQHCNTRKGSTIYKLIDLGYAKDLNDTVVSFVGTLHYLAPEIIKMEKYNYSVDYWSFGITAFEIICGVLPFLPHMTPFERFPYIEKKRPEHICIYQLQSGSITNSSELLKENHISSCFKRNLEIWLRHVLQHDPALRMQLFPDQSNVFENMLKILKKPIIKVFSVYTLEFYSYEINEGTLLSTLKDWIARDTKVDRNNQIILTASHFGLISEEKLVQDILAEDLFVYVFNVGHFFKPDITFNTPKSVRILFEIGSGKISTWKDLRPLYIKSFFFLTQEEELILALIHAVKLFFDHMKVTTKHLYKVFSALHRQVSNLVVRSECYFNLRCSVSSQNGDEFKKSLKTFKTLIVHVEAVMNNTNYLLRKFEDFTKRQIILDKHQFHIGSHMKVLLNWRVREAEVLISKAAPVREMKRLLSKNFKFKDQFLFKKDFQNYIKATSVAIRDNYNFFTFIDKFKSDVNDLSKALDNNERNFYNLPSFNNKTATKPHKGLVNGSSSGEADLDAIMLINENEDLIQKFEQVMSMVMSRHREMSDESGAYLK